MTLRIYVVRHTESGDERLISASGKAAALRYAVRTSHTVDLADQYKLVSLLANEIELEHADDDKAGDEPEADG